MFEYLKGTIAYKKDNYLVVDVGRVGYKVFASSYSLANAELKQVQTLYIQTVIREDTFDLYGFCSIEERHMFQLLVSISGVGPKAALNILSILEPSSLALAIVTNDNKAIQKASGIGGKTAARICLELQSKITNEQALVGADALIVPQTAQSCQDAELALLALGFTSSQIKSALSQIDATNTEEIIKKALLLLSL